MRPRLPEEPWMLVIALIVLFAMAALTEVRQ